MAKQLLGHPPVPILPAAERGVVEQAWQEVSRRATMAKKRRDDDDDNFILILLLSILGGDVEGWLVEGRYFKWNRVETGAGFIFDGLPCVTLIRLTCLTRLRAY